jgi:hypothetical protein
MLPGRSLAGKTTLVSELLKAGATYYSDEYAVLDAHGRVHPYARRLSVRQESGVGVSRRSPEEFGSQTGHKPLPVGLIAITKYQPDAHWRPKALTPGKAVLELMNNSVSAQTQPEMVLNTLHQVAPHTRTFKSFRGEAKETAAILLQEALS